MISATNRIFRGLRLLARTILIDLNERVEFGIYYRYAGKVCFDQFNRTKFARADLLGHFRGRQVRHFTHEDVSLAREKSQISSEWWMRRELCSDETREHCDNPCFCSSRSLRAIPSNVSWMLAQFV